MSTLSALTAVGWIAREGDFTELPCDACEGVAWFVRMQAPDCNVTTLAGVGGAHSDVYSIRCATCKAGA